MQEKMSIAKRWDKEYENGRYANSQPIPFVKTILDVLKNHPKIRNRRGIYVGCGNGRNYIPLRKAGLDLHGLDVSQVAIKNLSNDLDDASEKLTCEDFLLFSTKILFDYVIAIQVFQHGDKKAIDSYFEKINEIIRPGGLFFLRVNSDSTQVYHDHHIIEHGVHGGFTVEYHDGPKSGLAVHFFSKDEIIKLVEKTFILLDGPREDISTRSPPEKGQWSQWECVLQKKA